jgi:hypothetical protein
MIIRFLTLACNIAKALAGIVSIGNERFNASAEILYERLRSEPVPKRYSYRNKRGDTNEYWYFLLMQYRLVLMKEQ